MLALIRSFHRGKRLKRLVIISLPILLFVFSLQFAEKLAFLRSQSSDAIINSLYAKVHDNDNDSTITLSNDDVCSEYFQSLFSRNNQWGIRGFGDSRTSYFSKKRVINSIKHLGIYSHCFIKNSAPHGDLDFDKLERRLFPAFTRELPTFNRWDGYSVEGFPNLDKLRTAETKDYDGRRTSQVPFWRHVKDTMKGKGIVISIGEGGVDEVKRLLKVLRVLQNTLPIQLVHKGDVSASSMQDIITVGRGSVSVEKEDRVGELGYPQDIWFVNAERSITDGSLNIFERFSNKWIASLFNSFDEMILMDSDSVPFVNPETLFDEVGYRETGAFFFRDRPLDEFIKPSDVKFYKKLLPLEKERSVFRMPHLTKFTSQNELLKLGYKHLMESGVVLMKRKSHLPGLLISSTMQLWKETSEPVYGDKELFWLGQSISGSEEYRFNKHAAGALGILKQDGAGNKDYICSTQPTHFNEQFKLLWANGGLRNCKKASWEIEFHKIKPLKETHKSVEELKKYYESPLIANGAIILRRSSLSLFQKLRETKTGFQKRLSMGCCGYVWCAYYDPNESEGHLIHFNDKEVNSINFLAKVWSSA